MPQKRLPIRKLVQFAGASRTTTSFRRTALGATIPYRTSGCRNGESVSKPIFDSWPSSSDGSASRGLANRPPIAIKNCMFMLSVPYRANFVAFMLAVTALPACREQSRTAESLQTPPSPPAVTRTRDDVVRLIQRKNEAIAELESGEFKAGIARLERLAAELPAESSVAMNLAVGYILLLKSPAVSAQDGSEGYRSSALQAERAANRLLLVAGDSAASHILASKIFRLLRQERRSLAELNRAVELEPDDPIVWYEMFQAGQFTEDEQVKARSCEALGRACHLQPDNLAILRERLLQQVSDHDPRIAETLAQTRRTVEPLVGDSRIWQRLNLIGLIDQAVAAVVDQTRDGEAKWNVVLQRVRPITNVMAAEHATRIDRRRIDRQDQADMAELAFIRHDFAAGDPAVDSQMFGPTETPVPVKFVRLPEEQQFPRVTTTRGVQVVDFDLDGRLDVMAVHERAIEVFGREKHVWKQLARFDSPEELRGIVAADLDRDVDSAQASGPDSNRPIADMDIVAFGPDGVLVLEHRLDQAAGGRSLKAIPQAAALEHMRNVLAVTVVDLNQDGNLDLVVSSATGVSLWSNRGGLTFEDLSGRGSPPPADLNATAILPVDWNCDGDVDVLLSGPSSRSIGYLANLRHGRFRWSPHCTENGGAIGTSALCLDGADGNHGWTLVAGGDNGVSLDRTRVLKSSLVQSLRTNKLTARSVTGLLSWDYDNDGWPDVLGWGKNGITVCRGGPNGHFSEVLGLFNDAPTHVETCEVGDVDGDGDLDLLAIELGYPVWYENQGGNRNHWLDVRLQADPYPTQSPDLAVNMYGIGSLLELKAGAGCQRQLVTRATSHFGLGSIDRADVLRVLWTNSTACNSIRPESNQTLVKTQKHAGM